MSLNAKPNPDLLKIGGIKIIDSVGAVEETYSMTFGKPSKLNGIVKVPVTMAAEMVQDYHIEEVPFMKEYVAEGTDRVPIFKPFEELAAAIQDLETRGIKELPFVIPHSDATFMEGQVPEEYKDMITDFIKESEIRGKIKEFKIDDVNRKIKATLYASIDKNDPKFIESIEQGEKTNVSIGFVCEFHLQDGIWKDRKYLAAQRKIKLGHLAGLPDGVGKCPIGTCGINQDTTAKLPPMPRVIWLFKRIAESFVADLPEKVIPLDPILPNANLLDNSTGIIPIYTPNPLSIKELASSMTEAELQKLIELKDAQIAKLQTETQTFKDAKYTEQMGILSTKVNDLGTQLATLQKIADGNAAEAKDAKAKLAETQEKLKKVEEIEAGKDRAILATKFGGMDAILDPEKNIKIKDLCAHDAHLAALMVKGQADAQLSANGFPRPNPSERQSAFDGMNGLPPKAGSMMVDPNSVLPKGGQ